MHWQHNRISRNKMYIKKKKLMIKLSLHDFITIFYWKNCDNFVCHVFEYLPSQNIGAVNRIMGLRSQIKNISKNVHATMSMVNTCPTVLPT